LCDSEKAGGEIGRGPVHCARYMDGVADRRQVAGRHANSAKLFLRKSYVNRFMPLSFPICTAISRSVSGKSSSPSLCNKLMD